MAIHLSLFLKLVMDYWQLWEQAQRDAYWKANGNDSKCMCWIFTAFHSVTSID